MTDPSEFKSQREALGIVPTPPDPLDDPHIPTRLRAICAAMRRATGRRYSYGHLALGCGVTLSTVNRWMRGESAPSPLAMEKIFALIAEIRAEK